MVEKTWLSEFSGSQNAEAQSQAQVEEAPIQEGKSWLSEFSAPQEETAQEQNAPQEEAPSKPSSAAEAATDVGIQAARGVASAYTWPLDLLKALVVGAHHPMPEHEILELERRTGIPIDREKLQKSQEEFAELGKQIGGYVPTQEMAEKAIEKHAGISLEPKTRAGKFAHQAAELASLAKGKGLAKAVGKGAAGAAATLALEESGAASPEVSKLAGDVLSMVSGRRPKGFTASEQELKKVAEAHNLPFPELMTREKAPFIRAEISDAAKQALKRDFNVSMREAIDRVASDEIPVRSLQRRGINLDEFQRHAHEEVNRAASRISAKANTKPMVDAIDRRIQSLDRSIKDKSKVQPSSHAKQKAIDILKEHKRQLKPKPSKETPEVRPVNDNMTVPQLREFLKNRKKFEAPPKKPPKPKLMTPSELVERYRDNNKNVRELYRKAHETPVDEEVERTYAFLNNLIMQQVDRVGGRELSSKFRAANKITKEVKKSEQLEQFLASAMKEGDFVPGKLETKLASPKSQKIRDILGPRGVQEMNDIAEYRSLAETNIEKFLNLPGSAFRKEVSDWGVLAPILFFSPKSGVATYIGRKGASRIQGKLLTNPATRKSYQRITKLAAAGRYDLLKKDFEKLNKYVSKEYGSPENFVDYVMSEED